MEVTIVALALLVLAAALAGVGVAGLAGRLPRNRVVGMRVEALRGSDEAWRAGHRASGVALILAAIPPAVVGVAMLIEPPTAVGDWMLVYAVAGVITGGLIALASRQADRAARAVGGDA